MKVRLLVVFISLMCQVCFAIDMNPDGWDYQYDKAVECEKAQDLICFKESYKNIKNPYAKHKEYGDTLLSMAITARSSEIAIWLLDQGVDPNDGSRQIPLNNALWRSDMGLENANELVSKLIASGADVNSKGLWGKTPLHEAKLSEFETIKILLENKANPNIAADNGQTPLHFFAADCKDIRIIPELVKYGAKSVPDNAGNTPIHKMIGRWIGDDGLTVLNVLIISGADPNAKNKEGKTALNLLEERQSPQLFRELQAKLIELSSK
jgi:ankyrin repeat protein